MIFYSEKEYNGKFKKKIDQLLGSKKSILEQFKYGTAGSALYFIQNTNLDSNLQKLSYSHPRCNFEKFENGLLLRINQNQKLYFVAVSYSNITSIEVGKGQEKIAPLLLSPMWILLFLGAPLKFARYFRIHLSEYSIKPLILTIKSGSNYIRLESNGYNYYEEMNYFAPLIKKLR